jgi:hypothetical protein
VYFRRILFFDYISINIIDNFNKINDLLYNAANTNFELFKPFLMILLPLFTVLLLVLYSKGLTEGILIINLSIMLMFWYLEYVAEVKSQLFIFVALSVATYAVNSYKKNLKDLAKKGLQINLKGNSIVANIIVYSLVIALIGIFLPQSYEGHYFEESMQRWVNPFSPDPNASLKKAREGKYGLSYSGYSNSEKNLGGPLQLSSELAFQVKADRQYYLKGDVRDKYTGNSWSKSEEKYENKADISDSMVNKYLYSIEKKSITIIPQKLFTNTMFVPNYSIKVTLDKGKIYNETNGVTFINSSKISKQYSVEFYDTYTVEELLSRRFNNSEIRFRKENYAKYLQTPQNISQRTFDLVANIIRGARNNSEKIEKIREYLTHNYSYSLDVTTVPTGQEFLDYFLFTEKKGYCTYFATAMTVMCRIAGIPARYVEGFKMPTESKDGIFDVTNEQAHAWTEVLYQGNPDLWVIKDCSPTPQEERERIAQEQIENSTTPEETVTPSPEENTPKQNEEFEEEEEVGETGGSYTTISYRLITFIILVSLIFIYLIIRLLLFFRRKSKILSCKSHIPFYNYTLKRLHTIGLKKAVTSTERDFIKEIEQNSLKEEMRELVDKVYEEFYGGESSSTTNRQSLYTNLEKYIRSKQSLFVYNLKKYFI